MTMESRNGAPRTGFVRRPDGALLRYRERGNGDALLLCAGTGWPLDSWPKDFLEPLARTFRVIEFDYPGTGGSPGVDHEYTTRGFAQDAVVILDALDIDRTHVLGHSMGGRVAQWVALDAPDRVDRLILVASGAGEGIGRGQEAGIPLATATAMVELGYRAYLRRNVQRLFFTPEFLAEQPEVFESLVDDFWMNRPSVRDYFKHVQARQRHATADVLQNIKAPTLVLIGERDTFPGSTGSHMEQSRFIAAEIPGATMEIIPEAAHGVFWHKPDTTARAVITWVSPSGNDD